MITNTSRFAADPVFVGDYDIRCRIATGGFGNVWFAEHRHTGVRAAVKILLPELAGSDESVRRFELEARAIAAIEHPCVVRLYDVGRLDDGRPYLVMEYIDGDDLRAFVTRHGRLAPDLTERILTRVCNALALAHDRGIVHRDVSPSNILLESATAAQRVVLLDFGIAKLLESGTALTGRNTMLGNAACISPEQIRGQPVDARADIYALGILAYYLLTGEQPFSRGDVFESYQQHLHAARPRPSAIAPELLFFDDVVTAAMSREPDDRPQTVTELMFRFETAGRAFARASHAKGGPT